MIEDDELACDISGSCVAHFSDRDSGSSHCVYCGKSLELIDGKWWTWDVADAVRAGDISNALPQDEE